MENIQRHDIYIVSRHSNQSEKGIEKVLNDKIYNNKDSWQKFLRIFFMTLGIGLSVSGVLFFLAYNWVELHKFTKIGLVEGLVVVTTAFALLPKINETIRNIILSGAAVLVGVLFAVFGQIYQTGANSFDFFLAWTVFITVWVFASRFAPLWLIYLILINMTFILYADQVARDWSDITIFTSLFLINAAVAVGATVITRIKESNQIPTWFLNSVAIAAIYFATSGIITGIYNKFSLVFLLLILLTAVIYTLGIWHALKAKKGFYLSVIPFSLIIIFAALLIKISNGELMFLLVSVFIIGSVTLVIKNLVDIQKKWSNEK